MVSVGDWVASSLTGEVIGRVASIGEFIVSVEVSLSGNVELYHISALKACKPDWSKYAVRKL